MTPDRSRENGGGDIPAALAPPKAVRQISERLEKAGYETWCVGGAVRDALLGRVHADWDLATAATPQLVMRLFRRTVPIGVDHGTVGVLDEFGDMHEVTTFRHNVRTNGRHAVVEFGASLDEDLARRDFTINAIAYSPRRQVLHDPFHGRRDLAARIVRAVGEPRARMREDRLRALRAIRFAGRFDFAIEPDTWAAIVESVPALTQLSAERIRQEIEKTLEQVRCPSRAFRMWLDAGALATLIPGLAAIDSVTLHALDYLPMPAGPRRESRRMNRLAALFVGTSHNAEAMQAALRGLRFSKAQVEWIATLADRWHTLGDTIATALGAGPGDVNNGTVRHWVSTIGRTRTNAFLRIAAARWNAARSLDLPAPSRQAVAALYRRAIRSAFGQPIELADLAINGDDLIRIGIPPGRAIGTILNGLLRAVIDDPAMNEPTRLLTRARELAGVPE